MRLEIGQMTQNLKNDRPMTGSAVIFDLDGTLLDTLQDLADTTNSVLEKHDCPQHSVDQYRFLVGDGVNVLFQRALPADHAQKIWAGKPLLDSCVAMFHEEYADRWHRTSGPYEGIPELLNKLTAAGIPLGVLSNKPHPFTVQCVEQLLGSWQFSAVFGQRQNVPRKPDPAGVHEILRQWNLPASDCLYVGDTNTDMQTGRASGCITIGVTWGFRQREELQTAGAQYIIDSPEELLDFVRHQTP